MEEDKVTGPQTRDLGATEVDLPNSVAGCAYGAMREHRTEGRRGEERQNAGATSITLELKNMELRGNDGVWAAGNYSVTVKDKPIQGNWFRILKRENGSWKIAMEAFARAGVIDAPPAATGTSQTPAKSK